MNIKISLMRPFIGEEELQAVKEVILLIALCFIPKGSKVKAKYLVLNPSAFYGKNVWFSELVYE